MKRVTVVGAGFSGLTLAHALREQGLSVRVIEKASAPGGLISTSKTEFGLVESAANALIANHEIESLFARLGVPFATPLKARKNRYIFWRKPRRWPLSLLTTLCLLKLPLKLLFGSRQIRPRPQESVRDWAHRVVNAEFEERLLTPALQGVYGGEVSRLSASLILSRLLGGAVKPKRGQLKGSIAPALGMGQLIQTLVESLKKSGVEFEFGLDYVLPAIPEGPVVLCTSAWAAAQLVETYDSVLAEQLARCESLPLVSITAFFSTHAKDLRGFGCLFPKSQGFHALGVLLNDSIFAGRTSQRSETWIFGGAGKADPTQNSDDELKALLAQDRTRWTGRTQTPRAVYITRWPRALPHYTTQWEQTLHELNVRRPLFLHGNYLGGLGLAQIYQRSQALAAQLKDLYVS